MTDIEKLAEEYSDSKDDQQAGHYKGFIAGFKTANTETIQLLDDLIEWEQCNFIQDELLQRIVKLKEKLSQ